MSLEQVGINHIILQLPEVQRKELLNGLRSVLPGQRTASFTMDMVRNVFNDTIGVSSEDNQPPLKGTLSLQAHSQQSVQNLPPVQAQPPRPDPPSRGRGGRGRSRGSGYARGANSGRGSAQVNQDNYNHDPGYTIPSSTRGTARGRGTGSSRGAATSGYYGTPQNSTQHTRTMWCSLCLGPQGATHYTFQCQVYKTPSEKRQRLYNLNLCSNCTRPRHPGECSISVQECRSHPGVRHYKWLCEAQWITQNQQYQQPQYQQYQQPSQNQYYQQPHNQQYQQPVQQQYQGGQA